MDTARAIGLPAVFPPPTLADDEFEARVAALTPADLAVLGAVFVVEHPATIAAVAERLGWRPLRVASRLRRLQRAGLVTRDATDWPDA